ncbi:cytochrome P450 [Mycena rosella]|uniref:Cytochrome P450 n=1 Tax=Mycena rosella TaxID=1033263 RepID=A0AAD7DQP5_MYCRO|nr:cytochrome P450 [Mycena rosella]
MAPFLISSSSLCALSTVLGIVYALRRNRKRSKLPLPPGPTKLPLVGNLFDIPSDRQWEVYFEWSKKLNSDIIHVDAAGTSLIILSSMEAIKDLFEKRSSLYSDRSLHLIMRRILNDPHNLMDHFRHLAGALIMDVAYGIDVLPSNDPYIGLSEEVMSGLSVAAVPGRFLVDTIPALKYVPSWVPGAGFKRLAKQWKKLGRDFIDVPFAEAKRNIATGTASRSFTSLSLAAFEDSKTRGEGADEAKIKATAANIYAAGSDTTAAALGNFVLGMLANPEAQEKAQAELDSVVGDGRLPDFADEVLRWRVIGPLAIPHCVLIEDIYRGYRIPAGSIVMGNAWALLNDEEMYPDPHAMKPERFLLDGKLNPAVRDPELAFGFGRRICPGRHMAESSLWIAVASLLATFNIGKARDENGKEIELSHAYHPGLIQVPMPFECSITPRSRQAKEAIQGTSSSA